MMKKTKFAAWCSAFIICCLSVSFLSLPVVFGYPDVSGDVTAALGYLETQQATNGSIGTFANSVWAMMAIAAAGEDPNAGRWVETGGSLQGYLLANADQVNDAIATDLERFILALEVAGEDSTDFGGVNYVQKLVDLAQTYDTNKYQIGDPTMVNDDIWGVMALVSVGGSSYDWLIADCTEFIKSTQRAADDGWSWTTNPTYGSDVDDTAAAIMALAAAGEGSSTNVVDAVEYLKSVQNLTNGGFEYDDGVWPSNGVNSESDNWVIFAITSINRSAFQMPLANTSDVVDHLLSLQNPNGSFNWTSTSAGYDALSPTIRAIIALCFEDFLDAIDIEVELELIGDFDDDGDIDDDDEDMLEAAMVAYAEEDIYVAMYDLDGDEEIDTDDWSLFQLMKIDYSSS